MTEQTTGAQASSSKAVPGLIPPLQKEGSWREPHVEQTACELLQQPKREIWRRATLTSRSHPEFVPEEVFVLLLRVWNRQGHTHDVGDAIELLLKRTARTIQKQTAGWQLPPHHAEQCTEEIHIQMIEALLDTSRSNEFWEIHFWQCLKRKISNCVQAYANKAYREVLPAPLEDEAGHTEDALERFASPDRISPQQFVEAREALALLTPNERAAFVLFHYEDWPQETIAQHLDCTDRTVRNLLTRAEKKLTEWRTERLH